MKPVAGVRSDTQGHLVDEVPTLEGLQKTGILRTAFGVRIHFHALPRVGAFAPTRGYRLQRLRRWGSCRSPDGRGRRRPTDKRTNPIPIATSTPKGGSAQFIGELESGNSPPGTLEALKPVAGSRSDTPGHPVEGDPTLEGLQRLGILRTAFGVRIHFRAFPPGRRVRANPGLPASTPPALRELPASGWPRKAKANEQSNDPDSDSHPDAERRERAVHRGTGICELPARYAGGVEAGSPGSRSDTPGYLVDEVPTLEGLQRLGILRTAFGVRIHFHALPRVGAFAPTRGYRLQRLRRWGSCRSPDGRGRRRPTDERTTPIPIPTPTPKGGSAQFIGELESGNSPPGTPEALKPVARRREAIPRVTRWREFQPWRGCRGWRFFAPPSGCGSIFARFPRVGAFAPTRIGCNAFGVGEGAGGNAGSFGLDVRRGGYSYSSRWDNGMGSRVGRGGSSTSTALRAEYEYERESRACPSADPYWLSASTQESGNWQLATANSPSELPLAAPLQPR